MTDTGLELRGLDFLDNALDIIEKNEDKANKLAVKTGSKIIMKSAKENCPVGDKPKTGKYPHNPGNLKKSIKVKMLKPVKQGQQVAVIGPTVGKNAKNDGFYGIWVEKGHRVVHVTGEYRSKWRNYKNSVVILRKYEAIKTEFGDSKTEPQAFMRPAYDENIENVQVEMAKVYADGLRGKFAENISDIAEEFIDEFSGEE